MSTTEQHAHRRTTTTRAGAPERAELPHRRGTATAFAACVVAAVAAVTLSGCGIRSTAVPVDAGIPASRTACPPPPGATGTSSAESTGPAVLTTAAPSGVLPVGPTDLPSQPTSETPWEALASALPMPPGVLASELATSAPGADSSAGASAGSSAGVGGSGRAARSAVPTPAATATAAARSTPSTRSSGGFSVSDCTSAATGAP
ncbi:hypothetical protein DN069_00895 [Streptacidiphilus pinicola]|uniref:Uncharacterized protein n=1 Tax=Streptacidiphilus pinicola TaxID=2219663 RepID=A0A2X0JAY0_9ACTN|nr:hypothetical protein [Streptacidiphilus pinicola]RAG87426.1 hypothetical protein DN069_00895 [Streptacidiphilus pinicola]